MKKLRLMCMCLIGLLGFWVGSLFGWTDEYRHIEQDAYALLTGNELAKAAFGMRVHEAADSGGTVRVTTTGGVFTFDKQAKTVSVRQRLPRARETATLSFDDRQRWDTLAIVREDTGAVWLSTRHGEFQARINCDSLLMFASKCATTMRAGLAFEPISFVSFADRYSFLDNYGGVGLYPLTLRTFTIADEVEMATPTTDRGKCRMDSQGHVSYRLAANEVFWVSLAPPKPYDWGNGRSDRRGIAFHTWYEGRSPSDDEIRRWATFSDVLILQSPDASMYEAKHKWRPAGRGAMTKTLLPADGATFRRVLDTAHREGMKVVANAGAMYFRATVSDGRGGTRIVRGAAASNFPGLHAEVKRLREAHPIDGVYFDELYPPNTVRAYLAARRMRELVGDDGVMVEHHDWNFHCVTCPPATLCWHNAQMAGESLCRYFNNRDWLRYACSTHNIANIDDYLLNNFRSYFRLIGEKQHMDDALLRKCLDHNVHQYYQGGLETVRFHRSYYAEHYVPFWKRYRTLRFGLNVETQSQRIERVCAEENAKPRTRWQSFLKGLSGDTELTPTETLSFDEPLSAKGRPGEGTRLDLGNGWSAFLGPKSEGQMQTEGGVLRILANTNSCAYLEHPLRPGVKAVLCRLKTSPGNSITYAPRLGLRWTKGEPCDIRTGHYPHFRMALTQRATLSAQHERACATHVSGFPVGQWHTLRYRFVEGYVIGEARRDDGSWRPIQIMLAPSPPASVVIGKTADLNRDIDIGGQRRVCWVDQVELF